VRRTSVLWPLVARIAVERNSLIILRRVLSKKAETIGNGTLFAAAGLQALRRGYHENTRVHCVRGCRRDRRRGLAHHRQRYPRAAAAGGPSGSPRPAPASGAAG